MKITRTEEKPVEKVIGIVCDKCKKEYYYENNLETDEFVFLSFTGGYSSIFGDGKKVEVDICQHCLKEITKDFIRVSESNVNGDFPKEFLNEEQVGDS